MHYIGGGFLCVVKHHDKEPYILLGRESYGKSKGLYADFGGGRDRDDGNINNTVLREAMEEFYIHIKNVYQLPYVDVPNHSGKKFYKLVIGRIDNYSPDYFYKMNNYYRKKSGGKYSKYAEMDKIILLPLSNIIQAIRENKNYVRGLEGEKIRLRSRLWRAFKNTAALGIVTAISTN